MAERIAAKENGLPVEAINPKQRKRVYIALYQCHPSKLSDAGVVRFDKSRGSIELGDVAAQLYPYLDGTDATDAAPGSPSTTGARTRPPSPTILRRRAPPRFGRR
jgi:hypothetical protein